LLYLGGREVGREIGRRLGRRELPPGGSRSSAGISRGCFLGAAGAGPSAEDPPRDRRLARHRLRNVDRGLARARVGRATLLTTTPGRPLQRPSSTPGGECAASVVT